jgi:uncharacterized membrane protein
MNAMSQRSHRQFVHLTFTAGVLAKGIWGAIETAGSIFLTFASATLLGRITEALTATELAEDPADFWATHIANVMHGVSTDARIFGIAYLLVHGVVNLILAWGLLRERLWAFPTAIAIIVVFGIYQLYQLSVTGSLFLAALSVFDAVMVWLIWHKWRHLLNPDVD